MLLEIKKIILFFIFFNLSLFNSWAGNKDLYYNQNPSSSLLELFKHAPHPQLFDENEVQKHWAQYAPELNYMNRWDELIDQYENVTLIGGGGTGIIYKAYLKNDRIEIGLKKGNAIALKIFEVSSENTLPKYIKNFYNSIVPLINLLDLGTQYGKKITDYFPQIYGYYLGPPMSQSLIANTQKENSSFDHQKIVYGWIEMELVKHDFTKEFPDGGPLPPNIEFEKCVGEWAGYNVAGVYTSDYKYRNLGIVEVPYYRAYHLDKKTYLFPPGKIPKRLDIDYSNTSVGVPNRDDFKCDLSQLNEFEIKEDFSFSQIPNDQIKHYTIPKEY